MRFILILLVLLPFSRQSLISAPSVLEKQLVILHYTDNNTQSRGLNCPFLRKQHYAIASFARRCANPAAKHLTLTIKMAKYLSVISLPFICVASFPKTKTLMWLMNDRCLVHRSKGTPCVRHWKAIIQLSPHPLHHVALDASRRSNGERSVTIRR